MFSQRTSRAANALNTHGAADVPDVFSAVYDQDESQDDSSAQHTQNCTFHGEHRFTSITSHLDSSHDYEIDGYNLHCRLQDQGSSSNG
jgi:hypothetical protein